MSVTKTKNLLLLLVLGCFYFAEVAYVKSKVGSKLFAAELNNSTVKSEENAETISYLNKHSVANGNRELFDYVLDSIRTRYVESVEDKKLYESALGGLLDSLDPHSSYMTEKEYKEAKIHIAGEFGGIGIVVTKDTNFIKVISPIDDTPAHRVGIKSGDYIGEIDDKSTYDMSLSEAVEKMRGKPGTKVKISILRKGENEPLYFDLKREIIKTDTIKGNIENNDIIYMKITHFNGNTQKDMISMFNKLKKSLDGKTPGGYILDLRNNPGGSLDQAIKVCELFLEKDKAIVSIKGRDERLIEVYRSGVDDVLIDISPLVVLVNEGSASASEIVAGAFQDHKRAVILGTKTFGKASVQSVIPLSNGGAIKLTTARYYTPNNRSLQADGIEPDIVVEDAEIKFRSGTKKLREENLTGHLRKDKDKNSKGEEDIVDKTIKKNINNDGHKIEDYQLSKAIDLIIGINIYAKK
ncbi:MAG: S41 family peptidase [Rickettsiales bacterium]|jgi:carboxyl-terminal processing protease|nr:S41 family peptidase [Rickettsiales bacterium]